MFYQRQAILSIEYEIETFFDSNAIWGATPWNVYREADLTTSIDDLTKPYMFILLGGSEMFSEFHLPVLVLRHSFINIPFELGNSSRALCSFWIHAFGRSRGEKWDLTGAITAYIKSIGIRDFDTAGFPLSVTENLFPGSDGEFWSTVEQGIDTGAALRKSMANWNTCMSRVMLNEI